MFPNRLRPVHADEPVWRRAINQRRFRTPRMRVGMQKFLPMQQSTRFGQRRADRVRGFVDMDAGEEGDGWVVGAVALHGFRHVDAVGPAEEKIILAVAGGHVDDACASPNLNPGIYTINWFRQFLPNRKIFQAEPRQQPAFRQRARANHP